MPEDQFIALEKGIYLLNHSVGRPPRPAEEHLRSHYFSHWADQADDVWPKWLQEIDQFRQSLAVLLNGQMEDFCPQTNLSGALTKLLGSLPRDPQRNIIVYNEQDFPSMGFVLAQVVQHGYELHCIPADVGWWSHRNPFEFDIHNFEYAQGALRCSTNRPTHVTAHL